MSITGGVPWYIELLSPNETIDQNIKRLCFRKEGQLVTEFNRIFNDLFDSRGDIYKKIIDSLGNGSKILEEIREDIKYSTGGTLGTYVKNLIISGYVSQDSSWSLKTKKASKFNMYRLSDNYLRFYLKYIEPNLQKINKNFFNDLDLATLPSWDSIFGFQMESLLLKNRTFLLKSIGISLSEIDADGPYVQRATNRTCGCQIDYLVHTRTNTLYVCEFKFKRKAISTSIIKEMEDKIKRFSVPRGFGVVPVLFHLGEVSDSVYDQNYFYRIVDVSDFMKTT